MISVAALESSAAEVATVAQDDAPQNEVAAGPQTETETASAQTLQPEPEAAAQESIRSVPGAAVGVDETELEDTIVRDGPQAEIVSTGAEALPQTTGQDAPEDGGLALPLWQLEVAAGILLAALAATTLWVTRKARRRG